MINIGIVCHSEAMADEIIKFVSILKDDNTNIYNLGKSHTPGLGTLEAEIKENIQKVGNKYPFLIFVDLGSSITNTQNVINELDGYNIKIANAPLFEGLLTAVTGCESDTTLEELSELATESRLLDKNV